MQPVLFLFFLFHSALISFTQQPREFQLTGIAQGTRYSIRYISPAALDKSRIDVLLNDVDLSLSLYRPSSSIKSFNQSPRGIRLDKHLRQVVQSSLHLNLLTGGCFDITTRPLSLLWGFSGAKKSYRVPSHFKRNRALKLTGYNNVYLRNDSILKSHPDVQIDVDGIAQGYTVDLLSNLLEEMDIRDFMVELGGEVCAKGSKADNTRWTIALGSCLESFDNQFIKNNNSDRCYLKLKNRSVTTAGNLSKYRKIGNRYFSHIIDPRSGMPVDNGIISVSVLADNTTLSDGLDNALMVMGIPAAFDFLLQHPDIDAYFIYLDPSGAIKDTATFSIAPRLPQ